MSDLIKHIGVHVDQAIHAPVTVTRHGRDRLVILSAVEYERLRLRDLTEGCERLGFAEPQAEFMRD